MSLSPKQQKACINLRMAGYSLAAIVDKTEVSVSSLTRLFNKLNVKKGVITADTLEEAKNALLVDAGFMDSLKVQIASSITEDLAMARLIREAMLQSLERITTDTGTHSSLHSRSLAAMATTLKITSDISRRALRLDEQQVLHEEIPTLTIYKMTDEEAYEIKHRLDDEDD